MYQIMIVDDEEPVLESFSYILEKNQSSFSLCGTARSGYEAIELCDHVKPDVVFMDVQMPGLDGISTISRMKEIFPETLFVLATAYERFDIAQKAISLGVGNYLVKPITRRSFTEELDKLKKILDKRKRKREESLKLAHRQSWEQEEREKNLLRKLCREELTAEEGRELCSLGGSRSGRGAVFLLSPWNEDAEAIKKQINYRCLCQAVLIGRKLVLFFPGIQDSLQAEVPVREELGKRESRTDSPVILGCGGIYGSDRLRTSYLEALEAFESSPGETPWEGEQLKKLRRLLKEKDTPGFRDNFRQFGDYIFSNFPFAQGKIKLLEAFTLFYETVDYYRENRSVSESTAVLAEIMRISSPGEWDRWISGGLDRLLGHLDRDKGESLPQPLEKALAYIQDHYTEPLQLSTVSEACRVSNGYLSRLFSEHLDTTFIFHLNELRTDRALELLKEGNLSIKEISFATGYPDPNYFSRIFRKHKGLSPSEV